ncbi:MAG TPA: FHA domain-containing protein, partial [Ornithinibacter sp.]|nr:FHA domain-containing protein [Ornithinibacter sp.]
PEPEPEPRGEAEPDREPDPVVAAAPHPDLTLPPPDDASGLPPVSRVPPAPAPRSGLIDAVPWRRADRGPSADGGTPPAPPSVPVPTPTELLPVIDPDLDTPFDLEPVTHAVSPSAEPTPPPSGAATLEVPAPASEHPTPDVTTHRGALPQSEDELDRPVVLAVLCPAGHPSPPHAGNCRTCGREIPPQQPFPTPRPSLGVLRISSGGSVPLDRGVLLGRAPRVNEELPANQRPHLLRVGGPDRDISRNHAEIVLEGWHVLVRDLGSTNGTTVTLPGQEPVRLRPTEDQGIEPGTVVTLADEIVLTYEVQE